MNRIQKIIQEILQEKKAKRDRCLRIADRKFDKPSAYKSGAVVRCRKGDIWKNLKEETPQSGESSGKPAQFKPGTKPEKTENLTLAQIIQQVKGIPYYKEVLDDLSKRDESWEVTKKVKEYAEYMKKNPSSLNNLPPIIVIDGKLQDGAHRISAIYLLQNLLDKDNNFWKNLKLKIEFWNNKSLETGNYTFIKETDNLQPGKAAPYRSGNIERCRQGDIWKGIKEIERSTSLIGGNIDYNQFVDWAKGEADKITNKKESFSNLEFQWAENPDGVKVIVYEKNIPLGYIGLEKFEDGYKINTLGVKDAARGKGLATKMYDYIISKTKLYSDKMQTPEARKLWIKLASKHNVKGYDKSTKKIFDIKPENDELKSLDPNFELYSDKKNNIYLVIQETDNPQSGKAAPYGSGYAKLKDIIKEIIQEDESLRKWFKRSGTPGKEGGWVDCNSPIRKDGKITGYKSCGRKEGEKRAKYPSCRPTAAQCKTPGKGKKWGKTK
jgi:hypothetical protein